MPSSLRDLILSVLSGALGLGPLVWWSFEYLDIAENMDPEKKRVLVAVVCAMLGLAAWGFAVFMGYVPVPGDRQAIGEAIFRQGIQAGLAGFTSASLIHGYVGMKRG